MIKFSISNKTETARFEHGAGPIEFGRESKSGCVRRVLKDPYVSGDQLRVEELAGNRARVENLSKRVPLQCADGVNVVPGGVREFALPARLTVGTTLIELGIEGDGKEGQPYQTIAQPISGRTLEGSSQALASLKGSPGVEQLARWFETMVSVQRSAASSPAFYEEIAQAIVALIGLDNGLVLLWRNDAWKIVARHTTERVSRVEYSQSILDRVRAERRTFFQGELQNTAASLVGVTAVVASPIFGVDGSEVVGAVYGARLSRMTVAESEIRPLEAQLVQVLAAAAGAGLARMSSEAEATRRHVQFEQFFSKELAAELDRDPTLLVGRDREVTVLVSDVRGFSRIAERLGARATCDLMGDVLECLTARIHGEGGVVVDYVGDGIMAMWNAPIEQTDHGARACRAALAMIGELTGLNERWSKQIGATLALGIGVNTGEALVGNTGSRQRLKYGPLGNTVNLASRVEGATKQLGVPVLITGSTHDRIGGAFATRRLCKVRVVGIDNPVGLYELRGESASEEWSASRDAYEGALTLYEQDQCPEASCVLYPLLNGRTDDFDQPALALMARAIDRLRFPGRKFDPVVELITK